MGFRSKKQARNWWKDTYGSGRKPNPYGIVPAPPLIAAVAD